MALSGAPPAAPPAALEADPAETGPGHWWLDGFLRAYAQILFSRSRTVGVLLLLATFADPRTGATGAAAVLVAQLVTAALGLSQQRAADGHYAYNALLVGLGGGMMFGTQPTGVLLALALAGASVLLTAAAQAALGATLGLPPLTLPYLACFYLLLLLAPSIGLFAAGPLGSVAAPMGAIAGAGGTAVAGSFGGLWHAGALSALPAAIVEPLRIIGVIFFVPYPHAGLVVLTAALIHSRFGTLLLLIGTALATLAASALDTLSPGLALTMGFNVSLAVLALGGVFFVPGPAALTLAAVGGGLTALLAVATAAALAPLGLPPLILPLNLALPLLLLAMRLRVRDEHPKAVDFLPGSPEENLHYHRTRVARFGARYRIRLHAPFHGAWVCTQAVDGQYTHRGALREALDFEAHHDDGRLHSGEGTRVGDYACYHLPVLATADGTVARVVDGVPDNPVGEVNTVQNWGNLVVICHAPGLYSAVCHLSPGSLRVREGQVVRQGEPLGRCGSSGRSPRPHLHFQLQPSDRMGTPTLPVELHDLVAHDDSHLQSTVVPHEGETYRNLLMDGDTPQQLFEEGAVVTFVRGDGARERLVSDIDWLGAHRVRSLDHDARLWLSKAPGVLTIIDMLGDPDSMLYALRFALPRLPAERSEELHWEDQIPRSDVLPKPMRWLLDFVAPLLPDRSLAMRYRQHSTGATRVIEGAREGNGTGRIATRAVLDDARGLVALEWTRGRHTLRFERELGAAPREGNEA